MSTQDTQDKIHAALLDRMNLGDVPEADRDAILGELMEALLERILFETARQLNEDDQKIFLEKMEDADSKQADIDRFLDGAIENYGAFVQKQIEAFFEDFSSFETEMKNAAKQGA